MAQNVIKGKFDIFGMSCAACVAHVEKSVAKLIGVKEVSVSLLTNSMTVLHGREVTDEQLIAAVKQAGYGAKLHVGGINTDAAKETEKMRGRLIASLCILIVLMYVSMGHMAKLPGTAWLHGLTGAAVQLALTVPIVILNRKYFISGLRSLLLGAPNMDTLVALGSAAAILYGIYAMIKMALSTGEGMELYFEGGAMILALVTLGKYFETRSRARTGDAIRKLIMLAPDTASVVTGEGENATEQKLPASQLKVGDVVAVRPGEAIPADGALVYGKTAVDESALTGESLPAEKAPGDKVHAGTINRTGYFRFAVEQAGEDTTLARMVQLVEQAAASKAPIAKLADKVAGVFVPVVLGIAALTLAVWLIVGESAAFALDRAVSVLVISCPCALGLATPLAVMVGTGMGAQHHILIRSAEALQKAHRLTVLALDKTGTLTEGRPQVTDIVAEGCTQNELLFVLAALEKSSEHPLSEAVLAEAAARGITPAEAQEFEYTPGRGIAGLVGDKPCLAGNAAFMQQCGVDASVFVLRAEELAAQGKTVLYVAVEGKARGIVAAADTVKPGSAAAIAALSKMGVKTLLLSGDNLITSEAVRKQLNMDGVQAGVTPPEKEREIAKLQQSGERVGMVGDGINDAVALTRADVGFAIGAGTDIAIDSADMVLARSEVLDVAYAMQLSRAVMRNIKENLFWAFFYNCIGIPLAAGVLYPAFGVVLNPMLAAAAMSLSSICVVGNALRLKLFKPRGQEYNIQNKENEAENKQEVSNMKTLKIEGMMCAHCAAHVTEALNAIQGVSATVELADGIAKVSGDVSDETLTAAVKAAGYEVTEIK